MHDRRQNMSVARAAARARSASRLRHLLLGFSFCIPLLASAQSCPFWQQVSFSDGARACLGGYPAVAEFKPPGESSSIGEIAAQRGFWSLWLPRGGQTSCPQVVGFDKLPSSVSFSDVAQRAQSAVSANARQQCVERLGKSNATGGASCECVEVLQPGASPMAKAQFEGLIGSTVLAAAKPVSAPPAGAVVAQPNAQPPPAPVVNAARPPSRAEAGSSALANPPNAPAQIPAASQPTAVAVAVITQPSVPSRIPPAANASKPPAAPVNNPASSPVELDASKTNALIAAMQLRLAQLESQRAAAVASIPPPIRVPHLSARALVIGNGRYSSFGKLPNPAQDARAIAKKFESFGIPTDLLLDADRDDLIHALNEHSQKATGKDVSILYYAGHGVQVEGVNYLIPVNMRADGISAGYVKLAGISLNAALDYLPAKARLVFLDACRDNPASRTLIATRGGASQGLAPVSAGSGTLIAYATRDGATAEDGVGAHSPYTSALLEHLDSQDDISLVLRQVREAVLRATSGRQEPWEYGSLVGEKIILPLMSR
jgi:hypothetical protein